MSHADARTLYRADTPRKCGSCTLCCSLLPVEELHKPRGMKCRHLRYGKGCLIYANRPGACRLFQCRWLSQPELLPSGWLRPDHCRVVFDPSPDYIIMIDNATGRRRIVDVQQLWVDPAVPHAHRDPRVRAVIEKIASANGIPTLARIGLAAVTIAAPCLTGEGWYEQESTLDPNRRPEDQTLPPMEAVYGEGETTD